MRVLFLTHRLPYAPNRGDRVRAFQILRMLVARGIEVDLLSLAHDANELAQLDRVRQQGVEADAVRVPRIRNYTTGAAGLLGGTPLTHLLLDAPEFVTRAARIVGQRRPDAVLAFCSSMARFALAKPLAAFPLVIDLVDVDSEKWSDLAAAAPLARRWIYRREAKLLARFERSAALRAYATTVVNDREAQLLRRLVPEARIQVVPNRVDLGALAPRRGPVDAPEVVFCGVMDYRPNIDGVLWFAREIWPRVRARRPDARFTVVGSNPTAAIRRLAVDQPGITVTGTVDDVRASLWSSAVSVAPLRTARGVQNKVLEAIAAGLPTVVTPQVHDGLPGLGGACRAAETPEAFASEVLALLALSGADRRALAQTADVPALASDDRIGALADLLAAAARTAAGRPLPAGIPLHSRREGVRV